VYAGGWASNKGTNLFYIKNKESSESFVNRIFLSILMTDKFDGFTFYTHNLGRFDSIFILNSLITNKNISIEPIWKDNAILSLSIKYKKIKIKILDYLQLIPGTLENILISYNCNVKKGYFPYDFVNKNNLNYIGDKPSKEFYKNITDIVYSSIPNSNWDLKKETLKYLRSDLEGLLEILSKFNENIFSKYKLNITKFKTISGLALAIYRSSYLPENLKS